MCGIAGILSLAPDARVDAADLRTMAAQLTHRGPDDDGYYTAPGGACGLAFRRLAIIDLPGGAQPLTNEDATLHLVFNGEIYNFRPLREELSALGHAFRTRSDSEVIVHAFEQWGTDCFDRFNGMFALAIWDEPRQRLILARDRFGKKPLAFCRQAGRLYFASEAKAILALPGIPRRIDAAALHDYLALQYVPAPHSIFAGFGKLLPGHCLVAERANPLTQQPYWRIPTPAPFAGSYEDARGEVGRVLASAVERRLISDVPLGAFLSGGLDSSIVVGLMRRIGVSPLRTFSIGFPDPRYDETAAARQVARLFQTEHHEYTVTPKALDVLDRLVHHYDEPFGDSSAIPTWYVSQFARQTVTVALTGDGGDEAFAGYDRYHAAALAARLDHWPAFLRGAMARMAGLLPRGQAKSRTHRAFRFLSALSQEPDDRYAAWVSVIPQAQLLANYRDDFSAHLAVAEAARRQGIAGARSAGPNAWLASLAARSPSRDAVARAVYTDYQSYLPYDLMTKVDIASMACGLECRAPFLDPELVNFALSLPVDWRMRGGVGKRILRDWAAGLLPAEILNRPKQGFGVPIGEWMRAELRPLLEDALFAGDSLPARLFDPLWLRRLFDEHQAARATHAHALWSLLFLEAWRRRWNPEL